jgi:DNA-binding LytR/AlgR family response regulator
MANVLVIANDQAAAQRLQQMLRESRPALKMLAHLPSVDKALNWLESNTQPDMILVDASASNAPAFDIFKSPKIKCPVIFVTGYTEFTVQAFRVDAADYLLKSGPGEDLEGAMGACNGKLQSMPAFSTLLQAAPRNRINRLLIRLGQSIKLVETSDIAYFYTRDKMTFLVTQSTAKRMPVDYSLDKLESMLDPQAFFRINRQFIVHISAIREMFPGTKSKVLVSLDPPIDYETVVSSDKSGSFKRWLVGETHV